MGNEPESQFQTLLRRAVDAAGGQKQAAAKAIGVTPARFSKLFHNAPGSYTLGIRNCFNLAALIKEPPQVVLRAVNKSDIADALDELAATTPARGSTRAVAAAPTDPLVRGLAQALASPKVSPMDREMWRMLINELRTKFGLEAIEPAHAPRRAGSR